MPNRKSNARPTDVNQLAHLLVQQSTTGEASGPVKIPIPKSVSRVMAQMGSKGGRIGGKRRLVTMTKEQRRQIASDAAKARWKKNGV